MIADLMRKSKCECKGVIIADVIEETEFAKDAIRSSMSELIEELLKKIRIKESIEVKE